MSRVVGFLLLLFSLQVSAQPFTVVLDPGHGGERDGAISPYGVKEKDVALNVALALRSRLEKDGDIRVILTREEDVDVALADRTARANEADADLLVSIHCNSMPTQEARKRVLGIETYFLSADASDAEAHALAARENEDGESQTQDTPLDPIALILQDLSHSQAHADAGLLARHLHQSMLATLEAKDRGVKQAPFVVLLGAKMPAVLVEVGFISHPVEGRRLGQKEHQHRIADALHQGIREFRTGVHARRTRAPDVILVEDVSLSE